jgi:hypothetical protein
VALTPAKAVDSVSVTAPAKASADMPLEQRTGELPLQSPTSFDLSIDVTTLTTLAISMPESLRQRPISPQFEDPTTGRGP